ncbi:hypothetical protein XHC_0697 [Xanthomonas hortorum pv. carotae str. M081]|nr:hypothetical protein XHC_0697 [Xanthomonas hortorum pv. carotae str. M081]
MQLQGNRRGHRRRRAGHSASCHSGEYEQEEPGSFHTCRTLGMADHAAARGRPPVCRRSRRARQCNGCRVLEWVMPMSDVCGDRSVAVPGGCLRLYGPVRR